MSYNGEGDLKPTLESHHRNDDPRLSSLISILLEDLSFLFEIFRYEICWRISVVVMVVTMGLFWVVEDAVVV